MDTLHLCACPLEPIDYGRGWRVSPDYAHWLCTRCGGDMSLAWKAEQAAGILKSMVSMRRYLLHEEEETAP